VATVLSRKMMAPEIGAGGTALAGTMQVKPSPLPSSDAIPTA
jgi:hypothetical protein